MKHAFDVVMAISLFARLFFELAKFIARIISPAEPTNSTEVASAHDVCW
jgi:hypothetical protein